MRLHTENEEIIGNSGQGTTFTISASAKAFHILSSGIYKHKTRAIVREVSCNANDAHIAFNVNEPWTIKAPSELDPRFIVRDFGDGLDHQDMTTVYTRYFESTKADDGKQTGAFGLGAKSPFSYTDTFSVTSYHKGVVSVYNALLKNGEPQLVRVYEGPFEDNDRPGLEVTVPVKVTDIVEWQNEISKMLRPFDPKSYILSGMSSNRKPFMELANYSSEFFSAPASFEQYTGLYAIYGSIVYPLSGIKVEADWLRARNAITYIHFDNDTLNPQPSREELQLDEFTIKNVQERLKALNDKKMQEDIEEYQGITNPRQLLRVLNKLPSTQYELLRNTNVQFFGGKTVESICTEQSFKRITTQMDYMSVYRADDYNPRVRTLKESWSSYRRCPVSVVTVDEIFSFKQDHIHVIVQDSTRPKLRQTIRGLCLSDNPNHPVNGEHVVVISSNHLHYIDTIKAHFGEDPVYVHYVSECEELRKRIPNYGVKTVRVKTDRPKYPNITYYQLGENGWNSQELALTSEEIGDLEGAVLGIKGEYHQAKCTGFCEIRGSNIWRIRDTLATLGYKDLYVVRSGVFKRAMKNENLVCVIDLITEEIQSLVDKIPADAYPNFNNTDATLAIHKTPGLAFLKTQLKIDDTIKSKALKRIEDLYDKHGSLKGYGYGALTSFNEAIRGYTTAVANAKLSRQILMDEFKAKHPVVYFTLEQCADTVPDELVDNIKSILGE